MSQTISTVSHSYVNYTNNSTVAVLFELKYELLLLPINYLITLLNVWGVLCHVKIVVIHSYTR